MKKKGGVSTYIWVFFLTVRDEEDVEAETEDEAEDETEDEDANDVKWLSGDDFVPPFDAVRLSVSLDETKTSSSSASEFSIFSIYLFTSFSQNQLQKESTRNVLLSNCQTFIFTVGHIQQASPQPAEST